MKNDISGAVFTISPMSDNFIEIILNALKKADTSKVWMETDDVSTTVRGKTAHIFDVTKAIFLYAATTGEHVAYQATYSTGCPNGNYDEDINMNIDNERMNKEDLEALKQPVSAKFSLYPLSGGNYIDIILNQIKEIEKYVKVSPAYYSTRIDGEAASIFNALENIFYATIENGSTHTIMTVSISANSPSHQNK